MFSIYRDQIIVLDLSRPSHCPQFIETKALSSIYRDKWLSSIHRDQITFHVLIMMVLDNMSIFNLSKP